MSMTAVAAPARKHAAPVRPPLLRVFMRQFVLLWQTRRAAVLAVLPGSLLLVELFAWRLRSLEPDGPLSNGGVPTSIFASLLPLLIATAVLWPLVVWRDETPAKRQYHWSMPVDVSAHDALRVAAGAVWLMIALGVFYLMGSVSAAAHGTSDMLRLLGPALPLSFVLVPVLVYLLVSALPLGTNRPLEWLIGSYLALAVLILGVEAAGAHFVERGFYHVLGSRPWALTFTVVHGPNALMGEHAAAISGEAVRYDSGVTWGVWLGSLLLWLLISVACIGAVSAYRRGRP
jgi:hypothetical protein